MPLATISQIRAGLVTNLQTISGLQALKAPVNNPTPPTAWVLRDQTEYDVTMQRGTDKVDFIIQLLVGIPTAEDAQENLDAFVAPQGPSSIKEAIESDSTLGGLVADLRVTMADRDQLHVIPGQGSNRVYLGTQFTVEVYE